MSIKEHIKTELTNIKSEGLYKDERIIITPQSSTIKLKNKKEVINFCANNYLGLANDPRIIEAAKKGLDKYGYGLASVRFICGTQDIHKKLEKSISKFMKTDDAILYSSCFDANTGLFETLFTADDAIISDQLNHASVIDGIRLCKAERYRYAHNDMNDLKNCLEQSKGKRFKIIATDGVFSMDGELAKLDEITELANSYDALVMVDDSHATGFFGPTGRGTAEFYGCMDKVDITTSTMGKALGGASGGFTASSEEIIDYLRNKSRPYLFSNSLAPPIVFAAIKGIEIIDKSDDLRDRLKQNTFKFRKAMTQLGFNLKKGLHPIVPIMIGDAKLAKDMASKLLEEGIYVISFSYPVVPKGESRIRVQLSAAHTDEHIEKAVSAFERVGREIRLI